MMRTPTFEKAFQSRASLLSTHVQVFPSRFWRRMGRRITELPLLVASSSVMPLRPTVPPPSSTVSVTRRTTSSWP